jgi:hypothetical protein
MDCSRLIETISVYDFDRHFQIARSTTFGGDLFVSGIVQIGWHVAEKVGNVQHCIDINDRKYRAVESYMRAAPVAGPLAEVSWILAGRSTFVGVEEHHQHLQPRQNNLRLFKHVGINNLEQAEEGYRSSPEYAVFRMLSQTKSDGLTHIFHEHALVAGLRAVLSFTGSTRDVKLNWLDDLPPADATTLHDTATSVAVMTTPRVLVAEVFEHQGRHADAILFAQTDLQDYHNLNVPSKVRAGRVLGRCHAALGQHMLSVSAFDAAIGLAQSRKLLLSEALSVRGRAVAGRNEVGGSGLHWDEETGKQRLAEVMQRMQGPREALERALLLSTE